MATDNRGFASMDEQKRKEIASKGGQSQNTGTNMNSDGDNFAQDRQKANQAGKKGGQNSHNGGNA